MKEILTILMFSAMFLQSVSGQKEIRGVVSDDSKMPLPGVSVQVKSTVRGTLTDINGKYNIKALPADTLIFSMVGMTPRKELVGARSTIDIMLTTLSTLMDEVVVIGYGVAKAKDLTAPILNHHFKSCCLILFLLIPCRICTSYWLQTKAVTF